MKKGGNARVLIISASSTRIADKSCEEQKGQPLVVTDCSNYSQVIYKGGLTIKKNCMVLHAYITFF